MCFCVSVGIAVVVFLPLVHERTIASIFVAISRWLIVERPQIVVQVFVFAFDFAALQGTHVAVAKELAHVRIRCSPSTVFAKTLHYRHTVEQAAVHVEHERGQASVRATAHRPISSPCGSDVPRAFGPFEDTHAAARSRRRETIRPGRSSHHAEVI